MSVETQQRFFRLLSEINRLLADYSSDELRDFADLATRQQHGLAPIIRRLAILSGGNEAVAVQDIDAIPRAGDLRRVTERLERTRQDAAAQLDVSVSTDARHMLGDISRVLMDRRNFGSTKRMAEFANNELGVRVRYNRETHERLVGKIIAEVAKLPPARVASIREAMTTAVASQRVREPKSFFSEWERIIRKIPLESR